MKMNSPMGKRILALVRGGDYAHAGELEAVELVFGKVARDSSRLLLDVGCGRGGTAHQVQDGGWGKVTGVDLDPDSIAYARKAYPRIQFVVADAISLSEVISERFDLIYLFNSFYAFPDQSRALEQLRRVSRETGRLIIFDYCRGAEGGGEFPLEKWYPLDLSGARGLLSASKWSVTGVEDITGHYERWYRELVTRIEARSAAIVEMAGEEWFNFVRSFYGGLFRCIETGRIGGAVVYARAE